MEGGTAKFIYLAWFSFHTAPPLFLFLDWLFPRWLRLMLAFQRELMVCTKTEMILVERYMFTEQQPSSVHGCGKQSFLFYPLLRFTSQFCLVLIQSLHEQLFNPLLVISYFPKALDELCCNSFRAVQYVAPWKMESPFWAQTASCILDDIANHLLRPFRFKKRPAPKSTTPTARGDATSLCFWRAGPFLGCARWR